MDRLDAIRLFVRVVERSSFSAAAREAGIGQSAVSKQIAALERGLGAQLLQRSSRSLALTEAGQRFYDSAVRLVDDFAAMESQVGNSQSTPSGLVRVAVATVFGRLYIVPNLPEFFEKFPNIQVEMSASDRRVNLIEEGIDLAIRHGELADSTMTMRRLATSPLVTVATKTYFDRHGIPATPQDLARHRCLGFTSPQLRPWRFTKDGSVSLHHPDGKFRTNDAEQLRAAILADLGMAQVPAWIVAPEIASGRLRTVLHDNETAPSAISAVYPSRRRPTARARHLIAFLAACFARDLAYTQP
jgi:LysR family transcriptional regulator for bpeEF and oprC